MERPLKSSLIVVISIFLWTYALSLLSLFLASSFSFKVALYLFFANLVSILLAVLIFAGLFTSLVSYLRRQRRFFHLSNLSHPLLLRLSKEAPGTYHHSLLVSNLASQAVKSIGGDSLLTKIGGYFHDIGKLKEPKIFIENQSKEEKKNELENPEKLAKIMTNHVKEGVKLASQFQFPKEVIDLISQHHGSSLMTYFYEEAKKREPTKTRRVSFRYPGPKPQTKEAAVLMLADSLEAKSRTYEEVNSQILEEIVSQIVSDKIKEEQLKESGLSLGEIEKIKKSFLKSLESIFHKRIEYPGA